MFNHSFQKKMNKKFTVHIFLLRNDLLTTDTLQKYKSFEFTKSSS